MKNTELRTLIREQVLAVLKEANEMSFINKARAKSSLEQIKKGKRSDGMGKFDAKVYAIKGTQEIELKDPSDLTKYSSGYKYGLKSESKITEAVNIQNDESAIKALEDVAANWTSSNKAHFLELLNQVIDYFHKTKLGESKINEIAVTNANSIKQILKNSFRFKRTPRGGMLGIPLGNNNNDEIESNSIAMQGIANLVKQLKNTKEMNVVSVLQPGATDIEFTVKTDAARYTVNLRAGSVRNSLVSDSSSFWMLLDSIKKSK